ncbi:tetratricopeptide repeat protein [Streptosporangium soli]|nr:tetratricopeptide repeat protein [Streptosporangium sp. KLBMP 9127]
MDAHRRRAGPYTLGRALLQALVPDALERSPGLVAAHHLEIRAAAPGLRDLVRPRWESVEERLPDDERILVPAPRRTLRVANGIAEFVRAATPTAPSPPVPGGDPAEAGAASRGRGRGVRAAVLVVENVHEADATDRELLKVLLRRIDPALITIVVCSPDPPPEDFAGKVLRAPAADPTGEIPADPARAYVDSDGTSDDSRLQAAYDALPERDRAVLHDRRAGELAGTGEWSARLGAIPYHREHGGDPHGAGARALWTAVDHCVREGFLDAVAELGLRGLRLAEEGSDLWWRFTQRTATALAALGRRAEARELWDQARRASVDPAVHAASAYGTAMLDARHPDPARRDLGRAMAWINQAIAISTLLPDRRVRAFKLGFDRNGRALIEFREGRVEAALALVESAIELAAADLPPGRHPLHRMVLLANRAQLLAVRGRTKEALDDYGAAIALDPAFPDHYLDRGNLLFRLGLLDDALSDYETALRLSPPMPEAHYNRAELRIALDDQEAALADLDRVLELDPGYLDAYINRAGLLAVSGRAAEARSDVVAGLAIDPGNPHLWSILGQLETADGHHAEAAAAFETALAAAPGLGAAWASRAILRFESGDPEGAVADLTRAIELDAGAALYFNRAMALRALSRTTEAVADLHRALDLAPDDTDVRAALDELGVEVISLGMGPSTQSGKSSADDPSGMNSSPGSFLRPSG